MAEIESRVFEVTRDGDKVKAEPEWTERATKRGLDPLGMQNAGIALYQSLLPGISNVTLRMRYYGFFCWVSDAYAKTGATTELSAWRSWVRRSEALYALASAQAKGQAGVGGIDWAEKRLNLNNGTIDFSDAVTNDVNTGYLGAYGLRWCLLLANGRDGPVPLRWPRYSTCHQ